MATREVAWQKTPVKSPIGRDQIVHICYSFAISNTINYYKEYLSKSEMITENSYTPKLVHQLNQKEKQLDVLLSRYNITTSESFQNDLLKQLTAYGDSYHLKIIDFKEPHTITDKGFTTTSYIFSLEGSFNGSLALLNKMENNPALGSIKHLNFTKKRNYKTNLDQLFVEVISKRIRVLINATQRQQTTSKLPPCNW